MAHYIDRGLFGPCKKILFNLTCLFDGNSAQRETAQDKFFATGENPDLGYPRLKSFKVEERERELNRLMCVLKNGRYPTVVWEAYTQLMEELRLQLQMVRCARDGDDVEFTELGTQVFGVPDQESVRLVKAMVAGVCHGVDTQAPLLQEATEQLDPFWDESDLADAGEYLVAGGIPPEIDVSAEPCFRTAQLVQVFEQALADYDFPYRVRVSADARNLAVDHHNQEIIVPNDERLQVGRRKPITATTARGFVEHEIVRHIGRRINGLRSPLWLMGPGLAGYLAFEEGFAMHAEYQVTGLDTFYVDEHFAICLALGTLDGIKRDFREVFDLLEVFYLVQIKATSNEEEVARMRAWSRTVRTFRGTTCTTKGACYLKDVVYTLGLIKVCTAYQADPALLKIALQGKCDPTMESHQLILKDLGCWE